MAFQVQQNQNDLFDSVIAGVPPNKTLEAIDRLVDWQRLRALLAPAWKHSPDRRGRPGFDPVVLYKLLLLEHLYGLSDVRVVAEAADRITFRRFLGLSAADATPDDTTLVRFRARLRKHDLLEAAEADLLAQLKEAGIALRPGSIAVVDATLISSAAAPPRRKKNNDGGDDGPGGIVQGKEDQSSAPPQGSTGEAPGALENRDAKKERAPVDPDADFTVKKGRPHYGYKLHVARDFATGLVEGWALTKASVHDSMVFEELLGGHEALVAADKGYDSQARRHALGGKSALMHKAKRGKALSAQQKAFNRWVSTFRGSVEQTIAHLKRWRKCGRAVYIGLKRVTEQMAMGVAAHNLLLGAALLG